MFLKQYNYKPRSASQSSGTNEQAVTDSSAGSADSVASAAATAQQNRRRSSTTEKFAGLQGYKRNSSDQAASDHRSNLADQKPGSNGILGGMWNSFTRGT